MIDLDNRPFKALDTLDKHKKTPLKIFVEVRNIPLQGYEFIDARALLDSPYPGDKVYIDCVIACRHLPKLRNLSGPINIMDHLDDLIPNSPFEGIGLVTFQNGIQNDITRLKAMGNLILQNFASERPLCIGFHNATCGINYGILSDLQRLFNELTLNHQSVLCLRQLIYTLTTKLPKRANWLHIAHSEGGLIANTVMTHSLCRLESEQLKFMKNKMLVLTYGAVAPVPSGLVKDVINTYSRDHVVLILACTYLDGKPSPYPKHDKELRLEAIKLIPRLATPEHIEQRFTQLKNNQNAQMENYKKDPKYITEFPHKSKKTQEGIEYNAIIVERELQWAKGTNPATDPPLPSVAIIGDHLFDSETHKRELKITIEDFFGKHKILR